MQPLLAPAPATGVFTCAHCGDACEKDQIVSENQHFCCNGCASVYQILHDNKLLGFYGIDDDAGRSQKRHQQQDYAWLDIPKLADRLIRYRDESRCHIDVELPAIHCASCLWLLERLPELLPGARSCTIDFSRKKALIVYDPRQTTLRAVAEMLHRLGYPPHLRDEEKVPQKRADRSLLYRIGVAGFCFGNIMLLSFPEYFGWGADAGAGRVGGAVNYLMLLLSLPVVFFAGSGFFTAAYYALKARKVTIDLPIVIGMAALFLRSSYEILAGTGAGYLDSLAGLVFFLLIGRWFQSYTFARLNFERDYHDYFPIAAQRILPDGSTEPIASEDLRPGDGILVRPGQLIPADGRLLTSAPAGIDYAFVTGEAEPQTAPAGKEVFAGGRAITSPLRVEITKTTNQSYLLQLWLNEGRQQDETTVAPPERLTRVFTLLILVLAVVTFGYWYPTDVAIAYRAATAVLIIACPCALALAAPFAYGTLQRLFARMGFYFRGAAAIRNLAATDTFVFDKTGTLTGGASHEPLTFFAWDEHDLAVFRAMAEQSTHPRSLGLALALGELDLSPISIGLVEETPGGGLQLYHRNREFLLGSAEFCGIDAPPGKTYCVVDGTPTLALHPAITQLRPGASDMLATLSGQGTSFLLSGDHPPRSNFWEAHLRPDRIHFRQSPFAKRDFITQLKKNGQQVLMIGDGINDAGALSAAHVGLAVNEDEASFNPACDGVIKSNCLPALPGILRAAKHLKLVLALTYALAFAYNIVGLSYAVTGTLSPVVAAILMPLSSISVVLVAIAGAWLVYKNDKYHFSS